MRRGASPKEAAQTAINRITKFYPSFVGAVIAVHKSGSYGAACHGIAKFPFTMHNNISPLSIIEIDC